MQVARLNMGTTTAIEGKGGEVDMEQRGALWEIKHRLAEGLLNPNRSLDRYSVARYGEGTIGVEKSRKTEESHQQKSVGLSQKKKIAKAKASAIVRLIFVFVEEEVFFGGIIRPNVFDGLKNLTFVF